MTGQISVEFEDGESYSTHGPSVRVGSGYANLEGYSFDENGMVVLSFGGGSVVKIPKLRLLRITETAGG